MTIAPVIWLNAPNSWPTTAFAECSSPRPLVEVLQLREHDALVRRRAGEAEAADREHRLGLRHLEHHLLDVCLTMFIV